jgi:Peptidase A4 family
VTDLAPEDVGVTLFPLPPDGFDPLAAGEEDLRAYGFPQRPRPGHGPGRLARWRQLVTGTTWIQPAFATVPVRPGTAGLQPPVVIGGASQGNLPPPPPEFSTSGNWSGIVAFADVGDAFESVTGTWTIPNVTRSLAGGGSHVAGFICETWIGFDGAQLDGESQTITDIVRAGTTRIVRTHDPHDRLPSAYAWWEWVPNDPVMISNLPVRAGDVMHCEITGQSPSVAKFSMANLTTGLSQAFLDSPRNSSRLVGGSAEWILERPLADSGNRVDVYGLGRYGAVFFDDCSATTGSRQFRTLAGADQVSMVTAENLAISVPTVLRDSTFRVEWFSGEASD